MRPVVLFLDDEVNVLNSLRRMFLDAEKDFRILTSTDPQEALDILRKHPVSVIVSDNMMPGMTGIEFFQKAKEVSPESVRVLLTAYANVNTAIDAINKGEVFKFVTKPWDDGELKETVFNALEQYDMVRSLKRGDEPTLLSLAQTIELKDPYTKGHCDRVAEYSLMIAGVMGLTEDQKRHIKYSSWLHDCGKIGVPEAILNHNGPLTEAQMNVIRNHSKWGAEVARVARLPDPVVEAILYHHERYNGSGYPAGLKGEEIPLEARILAAADFFDAVSTDRPYRKGNPLDEALRILEEAKGTFLDPEIVEILVMLCMEGGFSLPETP